ncbi:CRISPR-associated helicase Cas3' [Acidobacterium sp. S8]|uniref:CRISPR-associated helicase Cas3' n=1 Tax=Acidobacterium sp. S8 TaxID=1641854 RepID=UPI001C207FB2|nr:CRISPR-associated helicase Cas3' [Acidobacterium sp. S8]
MHLASVAEHTSYLAGKIRLAHAGELIGLAHDLGKYSEAFQQYLQKAAGNAAMEMEPDFSLKGSVDHSTAGAQVIGAGLAGGGGRIASQMVALCVASHHSGLIDCIAPDGVDVLTRRLQKDGALSHRDEAWRRVEQTIRGRLEILLNSPDVASEIDAAMQRIREKDSDEVIQPFKQGLLLRMLFSCLIDGDRADTADFDKPTAASFRQHGKYASWQELIDRLELKLAAFSNERWVDQLRFKISSYCLAASERPKGVFTLTVPTGGGKTLASLRFALHHSLRWNMDRIIYVSPYISIADQNAEVVRKILEPDGYNYASIVLEHHSSLTPDKESWRGSVLAENWDAPVVFTTAVQVLEALFGGGTRSARRLHAFANAVLVFDEVQTLPVRMIHMFNNAMNFLVEQCGASVVLCTATQPLLHRVDRGKGEMRLTEDAELMRDAPQLFRDLKRYETFDKSNEPGAWSAAKVSDLAVEELSGNGSCLVIVNTKRDAKDIYMACKERLNALGDPMEEGCFVHLSTRMCPAHRLEVLDRMKAALVQKKHVLCVSTQLIEAGVDIDFATVVRDLAGLDSIAQAAGRCNRNGDRANGRVHIVKMAEPLPKQLEEIRCAQQNARRVLEDWRDDQGDAPFPLSDPLQMERFFGHHFFARRDQMDYPVKAQRDDTLLQMLGENGMAVADSRLAGVKRHGFMQSFASAAREFRVIDNQMQGIIVPFGAEGKNLVAALSAARDLAVEFQLLRKAQRFAVNTFQWEMDSLTRSGAIYEVQAGTGVFCLLEEFYSDEFGLTLDGSGRMESMIA